MPEAVTLVWRAPADPPLQWHEPDPAPLKWLEPLSGSETLALRQETLLGGIGLEDGSGALLQE